MKFNIQLISFLLVTFLLQNNLFAQQSLFSKIYLGANETGLFSEDITLANDSEYVFCGRYYYSMGFVTKIDTLGNIKWSKKFSQKVNPDYTDAIVFEKIITTKDSNYFVVGTAQKPLKTIFAKLTKSGDTIWCKSYKLDVNHNLTINDTKQTLDSGYVISATNNSWSLPSSIVIVKIDKNGNHQWTRNFAPSEKYNYSNSIIQLADSNFINSGLIAYTYNNIYKQEVLINKISKTGNLTWSKKIIPNLTISNHIFDENFGIQEINNKIYLAILSRNSIQDSLLLIKTNTEGDYESCISSKIDYYNWQNGKFLLNNDTTFLLALGSCSGSFIYKFDTLGNGLWTKNLELDFKKVISDKNKSNIIIGNGPLCAVKTSNYQFDHTGIIKTDSLNSDLSCVNHYPALTTISTFTITTELLTYTDLSNLASINYYKPIIETHQIVAENGCVGWAGSIEESTKEKSFTIYPNPSNGKFEIINTENKKATLVVYDLLGNIVFDEKIITTKTIDLSMQEQGFYFYQINFANSTLESGKLIISK